jgi:DNA-binding response OmpR family regulator
MAQRIMVVNDTQEILEMFEVLLSDQGYEVVLYSYAIDDMDEIERVKPDLIILDYIFGTEKMGWQMLQKLKMRRSTATIPVIVCTAATREVREIEGYLKAKGVVLVPKPFDIDDMYRAVKRALEMRENIVGLIDNEARDGNEGEN